MMRRCNHGLRMSVACATLLIGLSTQVQAGDEGGIGGLLQQLFGSSAQQAQPEQQVPPAAEPTAATSKRTYADRRARRSEPARLRLKTRYAALPKAEPLKVRITDRQTPLDMAQGPTAALLRDDTLRPGDIVVMPGGARVFSGEPAKQHRMRDFERIEQSHLVDRKTRNLLAAMMVPIGALPAHEARRVMARAKTYQLPETSSVQASAATLRIINPWTTRP